MPFTVDEFHDLIRLVELHPEWRAELRRSMLTDELLALPEQVGALTREVIMLVTTQQRLEEQMTTLTIQVTSLARSVQTLTDDVGDLKGKSLEADYRTKGPAYFSRLIRRPHVLTSDELVTLVEDAREHGVFSDAETQELYNADLVVRGRRAIDGTEVYLVVEISWDVGPYDVERTARRAALLARIGVAVMPVVAGARLTAEAGRLAQQYQVWQLTAGHVIPPEPAEFSSRLCR
jgi:hypothetical protein